MTKPIAVALVWDEWKLAALPESGQYVSVAKFAEDAESWPQEAWSIVIDLSGLDLALRSATGAARFLMPDAPQTRLQPGRTFEMFEGARRSATVTVL
jgi:hypothetical protein